MQNELRVIIRNNHDFDGITEEIITQLEHNFSLTRTIVYDCGDTCRARKENVEYRPYKFISNHNCIEFENDFGCIDPDILEKMLPYKSMAMAIMMRECHYDIYERAYLETVYYRHLKYWSNTIVSERINCMINLSYPHHCGEFILYALCKVMGIKIVLLYPRLVCDGTIYSIGNSIETMGENVEKIYTNLVKENEVKKLSPYMDEFVNKIVCRKRANITSKKDNELVNEIENLLCNFSSPRNIRKLFKQYIKSKYSPQYSEIRKYSQEGAERRLKLGIKAYKTERKMDHIGDYDRYSTRPDLSAKYIYYPLQLTPEASSMPAAGEFKNQLLAIEILSSLSQKYGYSIYVKEHWVQPHRERGFYKRLNSIPGVVLIDREVNTIELTKNSLAVATLTGTCIIEALVLRKNAIVFGKGHCLKGAPNIVEVSNLQQLDIEVEKIMNGEKLIEKQDVVLYLNALQQGTVFLYTDALEEAGSYYQKQESAKRIIEYMINGV